MLDPERHRALRQHFDAVIDMATDARDQYLGRLAADDAEFAAQLRRLVERDAGAVVPSLASALMASVLAGHSADGNNTLLIGDFRIVDRLGAGGMGEVFLGERQRGDVIQRAAIKLIHRGLVGPDAERRFATEQVALARLEHPGIARWLDAGRLPDGTPWYAMEYVIGETLGEFCDKRRLGIAQRVVLFLDVCRSVQFAHARLVLHRDLKPGNILVTADGHTKLLDFGIAKLIAEAEGESAQHTSTAGGFVSAHYSAPEMYSAAGWSLQTDVYSLCAMLYELLCGSAPLLRGEDSAATFEMRVRHQVPPAPSMRIRADMAWAQQHANTRGLDNARQWSARLRGDLDRIALQGLLKAPIERYGSVAQLIDDLQRWQNGEPVLARGAGRAYRVGKFLRRHWALSALATTLLVTVLSALVALSLQSRQLLRERDLAQQERDRAQQAVALLRDAFLAADPAQASAGDARLRDVLEAARVRLEAVSETQPALYAQLASTIGEVEIALGAEERAAALLGRAAEHALRGGSAAVEIQRLHARSAWAHVGIGDYAAAALALTRGGSLSSTRSAVWYAAQARLDRALGRLVEAEASARLALAALASEPVEAPVVLQIRNLLPDILRSQGDFTAALAEIDRNLAWQRAQVGGNPAALLRTRLHRLDVVRRVGRIEDALVEAEEISASIDAAYGADSLFSATASVSLGLILFEMQRYPEAVQRHRSAYAVFLRTLGERHMNSIRTQFNLAEALGRTATTAAEAEQLYRDAISKADALGEATRGGSVYFRARYAEHLLRGDRPLDALTVLADAGAGSRLKHARGAGGQLYLAALSQAMAARDCGQRSTPACRMGAALVSGGTP